VRRRKKEGARKLIYQMKKEKKVVSAVD